MTVRYITVYGVIMGLSNAERHRRFRERRKEQLPRIHYRRPQDRRSRPQRWRDAVQTLVDLQAEYQDWLDSLPDSQQATPLPSAWRRSANMASATWNPWSRRSAIDATDGRANGLENSR